MPFNTVFGGTVIYPSETTYLELTMSDDVSLSWPIEQQIGGPVVADIIEVDAGSPGLAIIIPDATIVSPGFATLFNNVGANTVDVLDSLGGLIVSLASGTAWEIYLRDNSTVAGSWRTFQYGASISVANAAALAGAGLKAISTTLNARIQVVEQNANYVLLDTDRAKAEVWTGGVGQFTLPNAATVGSDWFVAIRNSGSGNLTVLPSSGTINSAASVVFAPGDSGWVVCDGTNYFTLGFGNSSGGGSGFDFIQINVSGTGNYTLSGVELNRIGYRFTGILTGTRNIIVPGTTQEYWVDNETTGAFSLFIKTAAQVPGVEILQTQSNIVYCDGTNVIPAVSSSVSFPIPVSQGGTGAINAAAARTNLGATAVGANVFTAVDGPAACAAIGAGSLTGANVWTAQNNYTRNRTAALEHAVLLTAANVSLGFAETGVTANNGRWSITADAETFAMYVLSDDETVGNAFLTVDRTGTTVDSVNFPALTKFTFPQSAGPPTSALYLTSISPAIGFLETGVTANNGMWDILVNNEQLCFRLADDLANAFNWLTVDRTGTTIDKIDLEGPVELSSALNLTGIFSATLTGSTDNLAITSTTTVVRLATDTNATRNLTGMASPTTSRMVLIVNAGDPLTRGTVLLKFDTTSTAANRFWTPGGVDLAIRPGGGVWVYYDSLVSRWIPTTP